MFSGARGWRCAANQGAPGVDAVTIGQIEAGAQSVDSQTGTAKRRPVGIAAIRDRVVQQAIKIVIEPIVEADFLPCSFGFRPGRSAHQALQAMREAVRAGRTRVVDANIESFFDRLGFDRVLEVPRPGRWTCHGLGR